MTPLSSVPMIDPEEIGRKAIPVLPKAIVGDPRASRPPAAGAVERLREGSSLLRAKRSDPPRSFRFRDEVGVPHTLRHVLPVTARVNEADHLEIGGCDVTELAQAFGTPLFVFCEETFRARARAFRESFPRATISYAAKAFFCLAACRLVEEEGLGVDVASGGELHTALAAGFPPRRIILHGNNKSDAEIRRAIEVGVGCIAIDNLEEIERVARAARELRTRPTVILRVTPGVEAHTHNYIQTGQLDSKFGLTIEGGLAARAAAEAGREEALDLVGVHAHIGSNIFSCDPFGKAIEVLFEFLASLDAAFGLKLREVSLGGGIGIPYLAGDDPVRLDLLAKLVGTTAEREARRHGILLPHLSFEPGRFLVGNAMVSLYRVGVVKEIPGIRTYVSVDGGMSDNIRPALYGARYEAFLANKACQDSSRVVTIAGCHCESGDILVRDVCLPASVGRGDLVAVPATGAYGYSMASNYNKQPRPAVVLVRDGRSHLIIRRETYEDLVRLDSQIP